MRHGNAMSDQKNTPLGTQPRALRAALIYASWGWHVLPIHALREGKCSCGLEKCTSPGKHPLTRNGVLSATLDRKIIEQWYRQWPWANLAIATGRCSSLFVLDIDPRHSGDDSLSDLISRHQGGLPHTVECLTGGGGNHLYFSYPATGEVIRNSAGKVGPGIDVRGDGGYVLAPPSCHASGRNYEWEVSSIPDPHAGNANAREGGIWLAGAPGWLLQTMGTSPVGTTDAPRRSSRSTGTSSVKGNASSADRDRAHHESGTVSEGGRNNHLTSLAGSMRRRGMTEQAILAALREENTLRCLPPLDEREVAVIAESVGKYAPSAGVYTTSASVSAEPSPIANIEAARSRKEFEKRIEDADDFDVLTHILAQQVSSSEVLSSAAKKFLLKAIAKKAGVSLDTLTGGKGNPPSENSTMGGFGEDPKDFVKELNEKHAIVTVGGKVLVMNREFDPALNRPMITYSGPDGFKLRYLNRRSAQTGKDIGGDWLESPGRQEYEGVVFSPGIDVPGYYNLFRGWGVQPGPGSCAKWLAFVWEVICSQNEVLYRYVMAWTAHIFQYPMILPETAIVLRGDEGIGKNKFVEAIGFLVGGHYIQVGSMKLITGQFSEHLRDVLLVFANEAVWGGDRQAEGVLKMMISDSIGVVEKKGVDAAPTRNLKRVICASNRTWVVPRGMRDRRMVVIDVPDIRKEDHAYFAAIQKELEEENGYAALLQYFLDYPLDGWHPRAIPDVLKETGWDMKLETADSHVKWWMERLSLGIVLHQAEIWSVVLSKKAVYADYTIWCKAHGINYPTNLEMFSKSMLEWSATITRPRDTENGGQQVPSWKFPPLDEARARMSSLMGIPANYWE
ncbi:hypothetical protein CCP3SC1_70052 [Gammaproteobacteria bacterium]